MSTAAVAIPTTSNGAAPGARAKLMRVGVVSTYPPRVCGIGTFSRDLRDGLLAADGVSAVDLAAIVREDDVEDPAEVVARIHQDQRGDYAAAARVLERRGDDVVVIQHEYGIFGGQEGSYILSLAEGLRQPMVLTLHTVLSAPSVRQAETLRALCGLATLVCVFTETARRMILAARLAPPERVRVVPHGGPSELLPHARSTPARTDRQLLATFGLISPGKGIEVAIAAMPAIVARHPDVLYVIAGQTHPEVAKRHGEEYRLSLERQARDLGVSEHVVFDDRFLGLDDLSAMLADTTIYLTPYRSREQIVSGALTFAVVAGCATVSTPYYYAEDLLASGAGVLVPFDATAALAGAVTGLLDDPERLARARAEAVAVGSRLTWPQVGRQTADVLREAIALGRPERGTARAAGDAAARPRLAPADDGRRRGDRPARRRQRAEALVRLLHRRRGTPRDRRAAAVTDHGRRDPPPDPDAQPELPSPRLELGSARHAELHVLRPPLAGLTALGRSPRTSRMGARRSDRGEARAGAAGAEREPSARDAVGAGGGAVAAHDGLCRDRPRACGRRAARPGSAYGPALARGGTGGPAAGERGA